MEKSIWQSDGGVVWNIVMANKVHPDQTLELVWSVSTVIAHTYLSE